MASELAFVMINPYTISKSRTGGVIARCIGRTDLDFVAARMYGPSLELVKRYAESIRKAEPDSQTNQLIADYVLERYAPNATSARPHRVMLLLFAGEDAVRKIWQITGNATRHSPSGQTIRDTYGDYILDSKGELQYFEPAVLAAPTLERAKNTLRLWAKYGRECGGVVASATDVPEGASVESTLVMLKPDNFRYPSLRAGNIIDILSRSGLRITGVKKFSMNVAQAEEFYGPVREALAKKFVNIGTARAARVLSQEFGFAVPEDDVADLCRRLGPRFAEEQFNSIVEFMTGVSLRQQKDGPADDKHHSIRRFCSRLTGRWHSEQEPSGEGCLALVYEGVHAVQTIRDILGPTDPSKAQPGSVRREFGRDIMVNAAHASDSAENAQREMRIIEVQQDTIKPLVEKYYGGV